MGFPVFGNLRMRSTKMGKPCRKTDGRDGSNPWKMDLRGWWHWLCHISTIDAPAVFFWPWAHMTEHMSSRKSTIKSPRLHIDKWLLISFMNHPITVGRRHHRANWLINSYPMVTRWRNHKKPRELPMNSSNLRGLPIVDGRNGRNPALPLDNGSWRALWRACNALVV